MDKKSLESILACPKCHGPIALHNTAASCLNNACNAAYAMKDGIIFFSDIGIIEDEELRITVDSYNETADNFAEIHNETDINAWGLKPSLDKISTLTSGKRILDAGSGIGRDAGFLAQCGYDVIGLDMSVNMIREGQKHGHYVHTTPIVGNLHTLPFSDNVFDIIWACASLLHTPKGEKFQKALQGFHSVLKGNGLLYIVMMKRDVRFNTDGWEIKEKRGKRYFSYFTTKELDNELWQNGFKSLDTWENPSKNPARPTWIHIIAKAE